jgi:lipopolysaccharide/colanic/teichoic acid biosynthesis glycosyltransferase
MYYTIKSILDIILALLIFITLMPIFIIVCILSMIYIGNPIFFTQTRIGKDGKFFKIIKFRTMKPITKNLINDKDRLTKVGSFLRKTSLDELPQIINIIKGDMSFIGPRPMLSEYFDYFTEEELLRFKIRPGMTGYAEIIGRHELSWDEQFKLDVIYVKKLSFMMDASIFLKTIPKVLNSSKVKSVGRKDNLRFDEIRKNK